MSSYLTGPTSMTASSNSSSSRTERPRGGLSDARAPSGADGAPTAIIACVPLGLDRHPELWPDYFAHYRRIVWLAQSPEPGLAGEAEAVAAMFGLPLTVMDVGTGRLERELESLLKGAGAAVKAKDLRRVKDFRQIQPQSLRDHGTRASTRATLDAAVTAAPGAVLGARPGFAC